ncbi:MULTISPECIES: hypothetical protein [Pseudomonas]|uniref:hypothetical protein n=1 Tax=Pseudomonas TaxID=286 RepID=UPI0012395DD7|nr:MULTISPECIES: hypothetical protein [Pseudomonas]QIB50027.1 hypothetical protein G3M63_02455 [Pseudomonas sp. OIL-1]
MNASKKKTSVWDELGLPTGSAELMAQARSDISAEHLLRLASLVNRNPYDLAAALNLDKPRIQHWIAGGELDGGETDGIFRLVRLVDATLELFEADITVANLWLEAPCRVFER